MALTPLRIPNLTAANPIVDAQGRPTSEFLRRLNDILQSLAKTLNAIAALPEIQAALIALDAATTAAQDAADAANMAADTAAAAAAANAKEAALVNSYISPSSVLTSTPTTISIAAHTRYYADGTSVAVSAGSVAATTSGDVDYVSYTDPTRAGGAVPYVVTTTAPTQGMDIHVVGAVTVPATGTQNGGSGPRRPGEVEP